MIVETVKRRWFDDRPVIVAAPGPSLTEDVALRCRGYRTVAVQDAYRLLPWADILYGCDARWWKARNGCPDFRGEKWSTHDTGSNDKRAVAAAYSVRCGEGVRFVEGKAGNTFSADASKIHYGNNSGFQAVGLAILLGAVNIVLVGFDMRRVGGKAHFFGNHTKPLHDCEDYAKLARPFAVAAKALPAGVRIVNATEGGALKCFPCAPLSEALG